MRNDRDELKALVKRVFDKSDLKSDQQKNEYMYTINFPKNISREDDCHFHFMESVQLAKSYEELVDLCDSDVILGVWYGDFYSTNDNYPFLVER